MHEQEPRGLDDGEFEVARLRWAVEAALREATERAAEWAEVMPGGVDLFVVVRGRGFCASVLTPEDIDVLGCP